jgi:hypothetical protein
MSRLLETRLIYAFLTPALVFDKKTQGLECIKKPFRSAERLRNLRAD